MYYNRKLSEIHLAPKGASILSQILCINIGDQFLKAIKNKRVYQIVPLHSILINDILREFKTEMVYLGSINEKVSISGEINRTHNMSADLERNSIGYEIGFNRPDWKEIIKKKIEGKRENQGIFNYF